MILAIDTSTAACSAALFDSAGRCVAQRDELIGRGHAERLVPMIEQLLDGRIAQRILVGVGPGSFTGLRVGIAAAQGLAIGWGAGLSGMSSLALLASGTTAEASVATAIQGGHGELFVQQFEQPLAPSSPLLNLPPQAAAALISAELVVGPGAADLVEARGWGEAIESWPQAANALKLPEEMRNLAPRPLYARAPDASARPSFTATRAA